MDRATNPHHSRVRNPMKFHYFQTKLNYYIYYTRSSVSEDIVSYVGI